MARQYSNYRQREKQILDYLATQQFAEIADLCQLTSASPATVRRDLKQMADRGLVCYRRGQVSLPLDSLNALFQRFLSLETDQDREKKAIAARARDLVQEGDIIFIGAGKTCNFLADMLAKPMRITVVTNNISAALLCSANPNCSIVLLGGELYREDNFVHTIAEIDRVTGGSKGNIFFNKVFLTVDGIDRNHGYTILNTKQNPLYQYLFKSSDAFYILADSYKFDKRSFFQAFTIGQVKKLISSNKISADNRRYLQGIGVDIDLVEV